MCRIKYFQFGFEITQVYKNIITGGIVTIGCMDLMEMNVADDKLKTRRRIFFYRLFVRRTECISDKLEIENRIRHEPFYLQGYVIQFQIAYAQFFMQESEHGDIHFNFTAGNQRVLPPVFQVDIFKDNTRGEINI